jgi:hypothetical protein
MTAFVVDVNVAIVANGKAQQANMDCRLACVDALLALQQRGAVVLDGLRLILAEYQKHLSPSGQPGLGDMFMQWVWENQAVSERCEQVIITPVDGSFAEFPPDPALSTFDPDDRKYVAVALRSQRAPKALNAVDTDWWQHRAALTRNGVRLQFLCPQHME